MLTVTRFKTRVNGGALKVCARFYAKEHTPSYDQICLMAKHHGVPVYYRNVGWIDLLFENDQAALEFSGLLAHAHAPYDETDVDDPDPVDDETDVDDPDLVDDDDPA